MALYFSISSLYQLFIDTYLLHTTYRDYQAEKVALIPSHVEKLVEMAPKMKELGLFDRVIPVKIRDMKTVHEEIGTLRFTREDILHFQGYEAISFACFDLFPKGGKIIMVEEGFSIYNIPYSVQTHEDQRYNPDQLPFDYEKISEIWMANPELNQADLQKPVLPIRLKEFLNEETDQLEAFLSFSKVLYGIEDFQTLPDQELIFFDAYLSWANFTSFATEQFLLYSLSHALEEFPLLIKTHPNENVTGKYHCLKGKDAVFSSSVPWELLSILDKRNRKAPKPRILLSWYSSSLINQKLMIGDEDVKIIFLRNILLPYSEERFDQSHLKSFLEKYGDQEVFFPKTFGQLRETVFSLLRPEEAARMDFRRAQAQAEQRGLDFYQKYTRETACALPYRYNTSALSVECGGAQHDVGELPVIVDQHAEKFDLTFSIPDSCQTDLTRICWYTLRGRAPKIRLDRIDFMDRQGHWHRIEKKEYANIWPKNEKGYFAPATFDAFFILPFTHEASQIRFRGSWYVEIVYDRLLENHHAMMYGAHQAYEHNLSAAAQKSELLLEQMGEAEKRTQELSAAREEDQRRLSELLAAQEETERRLREETQARAETERKLHEETRARAETERRLHEETRVREKTACRLEAETRAKEDLTREGERLRFEKEQLGDEIRSLQIANEKWIRQSGEARQAASRAEEALRRAEGENARISESARRLSSLLWEYENTFWGKRAKKRRLESEKNQGKP